MLSIRSRTLVKNRFSHDDHALIRLKDGTPASVINRGCISRNVVGSINRKPIVSAQHSRVPVQEIRDLSPELVDHSASGTFAWTSAIVFEVHLLFSYTAAVRPFDFATGRGLRKLAFMIGVSRCSSNVASAVLSSLFSLFRVFSSSLPFHNRRRTRLIPNPWCQVLIQPIHDFADNQGQRFPAADRMALVRQAKIPHHRSTCRQRAEQQLRLHGETARRVVATALDDQQRAIDFFHAPER